MTEHDAGPGQQVEVNLDSTVVRLNRMARDVADLVDELAGLAELLGVREMETKGDVSGKAMEMPTLVAALKTAPYIVHDNLTMCRQLIQEIRSSLIEPDAEEERRKKEEALRQHAMQMQQTAIPGQGLGGGHAFRNSNMFP